MRVTVVGAGVAGLVAATELVERGHGVTLVERAATIGGQACSWLAGGMLAPWCERESAEPLIADLGREALDWWPRHLPESVQRGTLVVAPARDAADLVRFGRRTDHYERVEADAIAALEPDLAGRFRQGLFFPEEAHLDPRHALHSLAAALQAKGVDLRLGTIWDEASDHGGVVVDCRGLGSRGVLNGLRGVRGEMVMVRAPDIGLSRPIRLLHPRIPVYVVPRGDGRFMVGATMIESDARGAMTVRSAIELLNAAFTLHPGFAEAEILEFGADVRPAFADNIPRVEVRGRTLHLNGMYRHGFLLAPALARQAAERLSAIDGIAA